MTLLMKQTLYQPSHHGWIKFILNLIVYSTLIAKYLNVGLFTDRMKEVAKKDIHIIFIL